MPKSLSQNLSRGKGAWCGVFGVGLFLDLIQKSQLIQAQTGQPMQHATENLAPELSSSPINKAD